MKTGHQINTIPALFSVTNTGHELENVSLKRCQPMNLSCGKFWQFSLTFWNKQKAVQNESTIYPKYEDDRSSE